MSADLNYNPVASTIERTTVAQEGMDGKQVRVQYIAYGSSLYHDKKFDEEYENDIDNLTNKVAKTLGVVPLNAFQIYMDNTGTSFEERMSSLGEAVRNNMTASCKESIALIKTKFPKLAGALLKWSKEKPLSYKIANNLRKLALFLLALPFKAAKNIANLLYQTLKGIAYAVVHPIEGVGKLVKLIIKMINALVESKTWVMMGAGMVGTGLGQMVLGNPFAPIVTIVGAGIMALGLSVGAIFAAIEKEGYSSRTDAALDYLIKQGKQIPEAMMTGFLMGLLIGAIQKAVVEKPHLTHDEAMKIARKALEKGTSRYMIIRDMQTDGTNICVKYFNNYYRWEEVRYINILNPAAVVQQMKMCAANAATATTLTLAAVD